MKPEHFPDDIRPHLIPDPTGEMVYRCLECGGEYGITELLYTCPKCRGLFMLEDKNEARLWPKNPGPSGGGSSITAGCSISRP